MQCIDEKRIYGRIKRLLDFVISLLALILLSPLFLLIGIAIVVDDPRGGPIYSQIRIGKDEVPFRLYKFRSMIVGAEHMQEALEAQNERDGPVFKIRDDPRITRIGRFLRRSGLDELPQLWNVLRGEMSLVGPRPALPREVAQYGELERQRLVVRPGLTCYWQVEPQRDQVTFSRWMELHLAYIRDCSIWVDLQLMLKTFWVMLTGQGE